MNTAPTTADRILLTARRLFAQYGYAGTSIRALTSRAKVNLGAVTYHFGSKQSLYHAVIASAALPLVDEVIAAADTPGSAIHRLQAVMRAYFRYLDANRDVPLLLSHAMSLGQALPPPLQQVGTRIGGIITGLVAAGQANGSIRQGNPMFMALSALAQPIYFSIARPGLAKLSGGQTELPEVREALIQHALVFAQRGLAAQPEDAPK